MPSKPPRSGSGPKSGKADPEQYQRFLETARELGCEPTDESALDKLLPVVRRMAKLPPQPVEPMRGTKKLPSLVA